MTTNNLNEETRVMNNANIDDEATRMNETTASVTEDEDVNVAAPVSKKAMSKSSWAGRLGFAAGGAVGGFAAGYAVSANAGGPSKSHTGLAQAADPENNEEPVDTNQIDDPNELHNSNVMNVELGEEKSEDVFTQTTTPATASTSAPASAPAPATSHTAPAQDGHTSQIVDDHSAPTAHAAHVAPVAPAATDAPAEVYVEVEGTIPQASEIILANENGIRYAQVDDDMSFGEAFATARAQVGAPGVFTWHGNTYGTFYAEEWNAMDAGERGEFLAAVDYPDELNREANVAEYIPEPQYDPAYDLDIQIVDITQTMDAAGDITSTAHLSVDGTDVYMVDIDGDNTMDVALVDVDGDGDFTPGLDALLPIADQGVTVEGIVEAIQENNSIDTYLNDALSAGDDMAQADFDPNAMADF